MSSRSRQEGKGIRVTQAVATNGLVCTDVLDHLARRIGRERCNRYFSKATRLSWRDGDLHVEAPNGFLADWLRRRFGDDLHGTAVAISGDDGADVVYRVDPTLVDDDASHAATVNEAAVRTAARPVETPPPVIARIGREPAPATRPSGRWRLPPLRRFEDFVVGPGSRLAYDSARAMTKGNEHAPIRALFLHGECGLGKTHLLQAIAHAAREAGRTRIRYTTGEAFTNAFVSAVQANKIDDFRRSHRDLDLLCIDDVHFLANKNATQNEFLHTFDALDLAGARVVLASDEHPRQIKSLGDRLVSRFMSGLVVRIDRPDREARIEIVTRLFQRRGLHVEPGAIEAIVDRYDGSVRELEGAVTRVEALLRLTPDLGPSRSTVGVIAVEKALGAPAAPRARKPLTVAEIAQGVADVMRVDLSDIFGAGRHQRIVMARSMVCFLARELTTLSFPEIARDLHRPNHSTIVTACARFRGQLENEPDRVVGDSGLGLADSVDAVRRQLLRTS